MDFLERNAKVYPDDVALVEINPQAQPKSWREYSLIESSPGEKYRRSITWREFDVKANRFANLLLTRGIKKGDKVAILLMNCIDWLPIYFGILKTGALAVPMNYRYTQDEISYCVNLSDSTYMVFGPEFTGRVTAVLDKLQAIKHFFFVGSEVPDFADSSKTACFPFSLFTVGTSSVISLTGSSPVLFFLEEFLVSFFPVHPAAIDIITDAINNAATLFFIFFFLSFSKFFNFAI